MVKCYQTIEKLALALVQVTVKTDHPLNQVLRKLDLVGQMVA